MFLCVSVNSCLKPSVQLNINSLSVYDNERPVSCFRREAVAVSRLACEGSGSKDNDGYIYFLARRVVPDGDLWSLRRKNCLSESFEFINISLGFQWG